MQMPKCEFDNLGVYCVFMVQRPANNTAVPNTTCPNRVQIQIPVAAMMTPPMRRASGIVRSMFADCAYTHCISVYINIRIHILASTLQVAYTV